MTQHCSNTEHVNIRHETDPSSGEIIVTARRDIKAGEEFFYSYSKTLKPQQFLTAFGFVPNKKGASVRKLLKSRDPLFFPAEKA
jgi:SET domain-containing protein